MASLPEPWSIDRLVTDLRALGLCDGDTVMVHASLRAVGPVEGGAAGLLDALDEAVGPSGTLLMVLGARDDWSWVNHLPEAEREAHLVDAEAFHPLETRADPELGRLAEAFRTATGTHVTDHPSGRFGARGANADALLLDPPWHDFYGRGSPLERLCTAHGRVLRLGADANTATLLHLAEHLVDLPDKRRLRSHRRVWTDGARATRTVESLHESEGVRSDPGEDYFAVILRAFLASGSARTGLVGAAGSELLDASALVAFGVAWMASRWAPPTA